MHVILFSNVGKCVMYLYIVQYNIYNGDISKYPQQKEKVIHI